MVSAQHEARTAFWCFRQFEARKAFEYGGEEDVQFKPCERCPDAKVNARAKADVRIALAREVHCRGVVEDVVISIRRTEECRNLLPALDENSANLGVGCRRPFEQLKRGIKSEELDRKSVV